MIKSLLKKVRSLSAIPVLIFVLLVSDAAHFGRLFAVREASDRAFIGYVLAFALDGVLAVSLYSSSHVRKRSHRVFAFCVFLFACLVSAGFNVAYYRDTSPGDPLAVSILLGATAPILAALLSILKGMIDSQKMANAQAEQEAARSLELEKYRIEQAERTKQIEIEQKERTKRERAKARAEQAKVQAIAQAKKRTTTHKANGNGHGDNGRLEPGALDDAARLILIERPNIGPRPLARELECSPSTAAGILNRLKDNGHAASREG